MDNHFFLNAAGIQPPTSASWPVDPHDYFFNPNFDSMLSSPPPTAFRKLVGKLGNIPSSGEISQPLLANASCYGSPPKPNLAAELVPKPSPPSCAIVDPGFAERAARFSCFGSRSFNGRTCHFEFEPHNNEVPYANPLLGNGKLPRVSSSPSLNAAAGFAGTPSFKTRPETATSQDESTVSEANPNADSGLTSRKRKASTKGKAKDAKLPESNDDQISKKFKQSEGNGKTEEEKQGKNTKTAEPPKDYIHVRARRGQATDSHSLAERVRREKISERMKLLQDLVPGCNKVTGKALMLDEIINYVQSLQRQVEFLSMKLASVNTTTRLDINMDTLMSKDIFQHNNNNSSSSSMSRPIFPEPSTFFDHHQLQIQNNQCSASTSSVIDPLLHLPSLHQFTATIPPVESPAYYEGDLQTIFRMGIGQNPNSDPEQDQFHGSNQVPHMEVEG